MTNIFYKLQSLVPLKEVRATAAASPIMTKPRSMPPTCTKFIFKLIKFLSNFDQIYLFSSSFRLIFSDAEHISIIKFKILLIDDFQFWYEATFHKQSASVGSSIPKRVYIAHT